MTDRDLPMGKPLGGPHGTVEPKTNRFETPTTRHFELSSFKAANALRRTTAA